MTTQEQKIDFLLHKTIALHAENLLLHTENMQLKAALLRLADKYNYALEVQDPDVADVEFWYTSDGSITGTPWDFAQEELNKLQEKP